MFLFFRQHQSLAINEQFSIERIQQRLFNKTILTSIHTLKKETTLLGVLSTIVFLNGMLSSLVPILQMLFVTNKQMLIGSYGFTIVLLNVTISISLASGGLFGTKYLKKPL